MMEKSHWIFQIRIEQGFHDMADFKNFHHSVVSFLMAKYTVNTTHHIYTKAITIHNIHYVAFPT